MQSNPVYCRAAVYRRVAVYQFPFVSGDILSTVVGALLICSALRLLSGYSATAVIISGRYYRFPRRSRLFIDRLFLHPRTELGIFAIAAFIAGLFCVAGVFA